MQTQKMADGKTSWQDVRLTLHTYREGGSMICDEQSISFEKIPTKPQIERIVETYRRVKNWNGRVFINLRFSAVSDGEKN